MHYTTTCTCGQVLTVDAASDQEAIQHMTPLAKSHMSSVHPDTKMSDEEVLAFTKANIKMT